MQKLLKKEFYPFGSRQLIFWAISLLTIIVTGILFNFLWEITVFTLAYYTLRRYAGGFHAKTEVVSYIHSILLISCIIAVIKNVPFDGMYWVLSTGIAVAIIFYSAPNDHVHNRFDETEALFYRDKTLTILLIQTAAAVLFQFIGAVNFSVCVGLALISNSIMLLIAQNKKQIEANSKSLPHENAEDEND